MSNLYLKFDINIKIQHPFLITHPLINLATGDGKRLGDYSVNSWCTDVLLMDKNFLLTFHEMIRKK